MQSMYKAAIAQEQNAEYSSSAIGQSSLSSDVVQAAQDFMQAKNEMDQQTQLYQNGMDNTLDQATQDANAAFETLQQAQTDSGIKLVDTDNIQTAEDQLLQLSNEDISDKWTKLKFSGISGTGFVWQTGLCISFKHGN